MLYECKQEFEECLHLNTQEPYHTALASLNHDPCIELVADNLLMVFVEYNFAIPKEIKSNFPTSFLSTGTNKRGKYPI